MSYRDKQKSFIKFVPMYRKSVTRSSVQVLAHRSTWYRITSQRTCCWKQNPLWYL